MKAHIGIDIVHIPRFQHEMEQNKEHFSRNVFCEEELKLHQSIESLAGVFAAKEACVKAFPSFKNSLKSLKIVKMENGRPYLDNAELTGHNCAVDISISHDGEYAIAICQRLTYADPI
jgi:ADP-dependent NAD(P)H-hydrate dehydratase